MRVMSGSSPQLAGGVLIGSSVLSAVIFILWGVSIGGKDEVLAVDNVILCTGQEPQRELQAALLEAGMRVHLIGGADVAAELDAKRAINQGARLAAAI